MICKFLPAVSRGRPAAGPTGGSGQAKACYVSNFLPLAPMAAIAGAMPGGAMGASSMSRQARADAKREAKEARNMERKKRQTQYEQSMREHKYARL